MTKTTYEFFSGKRALTEEDLLEKVEYLNILC